MFTSNPRQTDWGESNTRTKMSRQMVTPFFSTQTLLIAFSLSSILPAEPQAIVSNDKFDDSQVLGGWNCGKITTCGNMGNICGGFNVKGKGSDIKQTFMLPMGTYSVELDFIRIDSWFVWVIQ